MTEETGCDQNHARRVAPGAVREAEEQDCEKTREIQHPSFSKGVEILVEEFSCERRLGRMDRRIQVSQRERERLGFPAKGRRVCVRVGGRESAEALPDGQRTGSRGTAELRGRRPAPVRIDDGDDRQCFAGCERSEALELPVRLEGVVIQAAQILIALLSPDRRLDQRLERRIARECVERETLLVGREARGCLEFEPVDAEIGAVAEFARAERVAPEDPERAEPVEAFSSADGQADFSRGMKARFGPTGALLTLIDCSFDLMADQLV